MFREFGSHLGPRNRHAQASFCGGRCLENLARRRRSIFRGVRTPEGYENNWIQTTKGQTWYTYFRFYNPEKPYFDKSWQLNDIEEIP